MPSPFLAVTRPHFLTLTVVCMALAASLSWHQHQQLPMGLFWLVLTLGLLAHISVNAFNEYFDFRSGLDFITPKTPVSGGSGALVAHPEAAPMALMIAVVSLVLLILGGVYLAAQLTWSLLWFGGPGVLVIWSYTQYLNRHPLACYLAPGVGFGLCMIPAAVWTLGGTLTAGVWWSAALVAIAVSNLLLLNQLPDQPADRQVGRRHLPIALGLMGAVNWWLGSWLLVVTGLVGAVWLQHVPALALWLLVPLGTIPWLWWQVRQAVIHQQSLVHLLLIQVVIVHSVPTLLALAWWLSPAT